MNLKGFERKWSCPNRANSPAFSGGTGEHHEESRSNFYSGCAVQIYTEKMRIESRIRVLPGLNIGWNVNQLDPIFSWFSQSFQAAVGWHLKLGYGFCLHILLVHY
jgi:hypothetical protein